MLAFSSDWTTLAGWRGLKTRLNSLRYIKGRVAKPDARHHTFYPPLPPFYPRPGSTPPLWKVTVLPY